MHRYWNGVDSSDIDLGVFGVSLDSGIVKMNKEAVDLAISLLSALRQLGAWFRVISI
jgi:hypothetical protein